MNDDEFQQSRRFPSDTRDVIIVILSVMVAGLAIGIAILATQTGDDNQRGYFFSRVRRNQAEAKDFCEAGDSGESGHSGESGDSGGSGASGESGNPGASGEYGDSGNSDHFGNSDHSGNSGEPGNSCDSGESKKSYQCH